MVTQMSKYRPDSPRQAACCDRELDRLLDPELFRALGDPTRIRLLACLAKCGRECSVSEVAECCSVDFSVVARHLQVLARAGLVVARKEGRMVQYSVRYHELSGTLRALAAALEECCPAAPEPAGKGGDRVRR